MSIPRVLAKNLYHLLQKYPQQEWPDIFKAFVLFLKEERMLRQAPKILAEFEKYAMGQEKKQRVFIETAKPLPATVRSSIILHLGKILERELILEESVVPELIGGIKIRIGDKVIDATIKRRLAALL